MAQRQEMFSWLDKKSLGDQDENKKTLSNQIATDDNDGAVVLEDSINEFILNYDFTYNSQAELINTYREVSNYNEVDFAIEDIVNEAVTFGDNDSNAVEIDLSSIDDEILSEKVKDFVYESWDKINNLLDLNTSIHRRFKSFYIDGRLSYQKVIDKASVSNNGLLNIIQLDPRFVTKFRNVEYDKANHTIQAVDEYFIYNENIAETNPSDQKTKQNKNSNFKEALKLNKESITYVTSGITDSNSGYAISWLHKAVKPANQLRMMENALVVYRITRAPERRVFYVDTSGMTKTKAEQYLKNLKANYRNRMSYDPDSGSFKDSRHLMTMQEDYWMPRNASTGKGTEVSTLPGGCFAMDTKVSLLDGRERSIAEIRDEMETGKELWTYSVNPETGKVAAGLISWAGVTQKSAEVMKLTLDNGEEIICTPDHKFPVYGKGFVRADELLENESMMPLYRKNEQISKTKKLDYEQYFDNESKKWVYTHRMVANELKGSEVKNFVYESNDDGVYDVRHHVDFDRYNNDPSNLVFMGWNDHQKLHTDNGFSRESILWSDFRKKESLHNHRVVKIEKLADKIEVGTLTIDKDEKHHDYHTFALSCGIFTKNSNLGDIEDVVYFLKRLYKALNIPVSRLEADSIVSLGRNTEINRDELKFGKFVTKVKKRFNMMFLDLLRTELILTKVITGKEWDKIKNQIKFVYSQDMYLEEQKKFEMMRDRLELLNELNDYVGKYFSHDYIRRKILKQSDEEIEEQDKIIEEEKNNKQYNPDEEDRGRF
jgi:hypothetical protein